MKIPFLILTTTASLMLAVSTQATQRLNHKIQITSDCEEHSVKQSCSKTMTSIFDNSGRLWSAWTIGKHLYVNYSDDNGLVFSQPVKVNNKPEDISAKKEHRPKIAISNTGKIYLSWTTELQKRFTGNIRFSKSEDRGKSFKKPITVNDNLEIISHRFDSLSVNKKGHVFISWLDKRDQELAKKSGKEYNGAAAYYAVSTDAGISFSRNKKIADNSCECCRIAMDIDTNDLPVIAWRHIYGNNIRDHSIVSFSDIHTPLTPKRLSNDQWKMNGCPHHGPSLSINNSNRYHAVWFNNAEKRHGLFYAFSDNKGDSFSKPINIGNYNKQASHADIKAINNQVHIVWKEFHAPYFKIYVMSSKNNGLNWSNKQFIEKTINNSDYVFLINKGKSTYISWHIPGQDYKLIKIEDN